MRKRKTNRKPIPSRTMILSTEQAESFNIRFDMECLNANFDPLLKRYSDNEFEVKMEFFKEHILYTLIDKKTKEKEKRIGYIKDNYTTFFNPLNKVLTFAEASGKYDVAVSTLRHRQRDGRFEDGDTKKSGSTWLVTDSAMQRLYRKEN